MADIALCAQPACTKGTMFRSIPWDVWVAVSLAAVVAVFSNLGPAIFAVMCLGLCAYIASQTLDERRDG